MAAQGRVSLTEAHATGGLRIPSRLRRLRAALRLSEHLVRLVQWKQWWESAYVEVLTGTVELLHRQGCGPQEAQDSLSQRMPRPWTQIVMRTVLAQTQRWISQRLELPPTGWAEGRLRLKLERWKIPGLPGRTARRILRSLQALNRVVAPRVHVAVFRTIFNGWVTERRFQRAYEGLCRFQCGGDDSIEHYMRCRVLHDFARRRLRLNLDAGLRWPIMMLAEIPGGTPDLLTQVALFQYVAARACNHLRHAHVPPAERLTRLQQRLAEGVCGHPASMPVHGRLWRKSELAGRGPWT